ncbi:MAG: AzlC family ABC transporter permease [Alphaproteobacteria bacterium]
MTSKAPPRLPAPYWSWPGLLEGARLCGAMIPGTAVFAAAYGTLAAQKGLTLSEAVLMSLLVFGGSAQLVALEVWNAPITFATVLSLTAVTAMVNSRLILMGATLRPWLGGLPPWQPYAALSTTVDATWLIAMRYRGEGGGDVSVFVGAGLTLWVLWVVTAVPGYFLGSFISDPKRFGFDLVLVIFFAAMFVPLWRGARRAIGWVVAGLVALVVSYIVPGWWFIVAGALAGSIAGAFVDE